VEAAKGDCSDKYMEPLVVYQCKQTLAAMQARLKQLGAIKDLSFQGMQPTPQGQAEAWIVSFQNGQLFWLAAAGPDSKLYIMWSPG
jgi:hypothetical protein